MPRTMNSPQNVLNAADFFKAKLQFESTPHDLRSIMDQRSVLVLDVRDPQSYAKEHIKGAVNIPLEELLDRLSELPKEKTVVAYCWNITCHMATRAALDLAHRDYKVQELMGGIEAWKKAGFPVEGSGTAASDPKATTQPPEQRWEGEGGTPAPKGAAGQQAQAQGRQRSSKERSK